MNVPSSASGIAPSGAMGGSGARKTMPCASVTAGGRRQPGGRGQRRPLPQRRDLDAAAVLVETPPVIGAVQHAGLAMAESERTPPVRAAVNDGSHQPARSVQGPGLPQQHHTVRLLRDLTGAGHGMPASAQRRVRVGQNGGHGATLVRPDTGVKDTLGSNVRCSRWRPKEGCHSGDYAPKGRSSAPRRMFMARPRTGTPPSDGGALRMRSTWACRSAMEDHISKSRTRLGSAASTLMAYSMHPRSCREALMDSSRHSRNSAPGAPGQR